MEMILMTYIDIFNTVTENNLRLNALVLAAQTYHETGGYKHMCGKGNTNLAGIKSSKAWMNGEIPWSTKKDIELTTQEYVKETGKYITIKAKFRWYGDDVLLCLKDIERIIGTKSWFSDSLENVDCCWAYLSGLISKWSKSPNAMLLEPGWATGHVYFESVSKQIVKFAPTLLGENWKTRLTSAFALAIKRKALTNDQIVFLEELID